MSSIGGGSANSTGAFVTDIFANRNDVVQDTTVSSGAYPSALDIVAAHAISVNDNRSYGTVNFGFEQYNHLDSSITNNTVRPAIGQLAGGIYIEANTAETNPDKGITISGNTIDAGEIYCTAAGSSKKMSAITVTGNTVRPWSTQNGISFYNCSSGVCVGNSVASANPSAPYNAGAYLISSDNIVIDGNAFVSGAYGIKDDSNDPSIVIGVNAYASISTKVVGGSTQISTSASHRLGFYGTTPIVRPTSTPANATDLATALALVNDLKSKLVSLGLIS